MITYLVQLALEDIGLVEEQNDQSANEPPPVDDALEKNETPLCDSKKSVNTERQLQLKDATDYFCLFKGTWSYSLRAVQKMVLVTLSKQ